MKHRIFAAALIIFISAAAYPAGETGFAGKNEMQAYCDIVMTNIKTGRITEAFNLLKKEWGAPVTELDSLEQQTVNQLEMVKERFGSILDYRLVKVQEVEGITMKFTYVVRYDRHITRWIFIFYKPSARWFLNSFRWDDSIDALFTE